MRSRTRSFEKHTHLVAALGRHPVVVDLGLNHGWFAMAMIANHGARVLGAEPDPWIAKTVPPHPNLRAEEVAITGGESVVSLYVNEDKAASVVHDLARSGTQSVEVAGTTLAALLQRHGIQIVDLLKVDIEGAEIAMFDSTPDDVLLACRQIAIEWHVAMDGQQRPDVDRINGRLARLGFQRFDWSTDETDVLYVHPENRLSSSQAAIALLVGRYARGGRRRVARLLGLQPSCYHGPSGPHCRQCRAFYATSSG